MPLGQTLPALINDLLNEYFESLEGSVRQMKADFTARGFLEIPNFGPPVIQALVKREVFELLETHSRRRELFINVTGNTPRFYNNVSQEDIVANGEALPIIYKSDALLTFLSKVLGETVSPIPYEPEQFVITRMTQAGDSHGWHWDDYAYSLVWMIEATPKGMGGDTEFVPNTSWDKDNPRVEYYLQNFPMYTEHPATGSIYLLKADTSMHRVTPITDGATRTITVLTFANATDLQRDISHETLEQIFAKQPAPATA